VKFSSEISVGNLLQVGAIAAAVIAGYATMTVRQDTVETRVGEVEATARANLGSIRGLEVGAARTTAEYQAIMRTLDQINRKLEP